MGLKCCNFILFALFTYCHGTNTVQNIMKCKYLKIRKKNNKIYGYCSKFKIEKNIYCKECKDLINEQFKNEYQRKINKLKNKEQKPIKMRSNKLAKAEKYRFSIIGLDKEKCSYCGSYGPTEINEVFEGKNRIVSIKNGFCVSLCHECHQKFHDNRKFNLYYKRLFQKEFEKTHSRKEFIELIGRNYLD